MRRVAMKLKVYADRSGRILATFRPASGGTHPPSSVRIDVEGAHEHEVEVADHLLTGESIHKLHAEYRIEVAGGAAKLVKAQ
jgi:hypothetical protein